MDGKREAQWKRSEQPGAGKKHAAPARRPEVVNSLEEGKVADEVLQHLAELGWDTSWLPPDVAERSRLFQRGGVLVQVVVDRKSPSSGITLPEPMPQIRAIPKSILRERITQAVRLVVLKRDGDRQIREPQRPPIWLVPALHERGEFGPVRKLAGITQTPTLLPDGSVLQTRGYCSRTGLLYLPDRDFPGVPDHPTRDAAARAATDLLNIVGDFPFESDAHRSVWLAGVLTLLGRPAIAGPCPLVAFDANTRGAGKSLLADVAAIIATGSGIARMAWPGADREVRTSVTSVALEGWPVVLFDNVEKALGGAALDAALTGTTWQDRILGESRTTGLLPLTTVWMATGNNLQLSSDTARRVLMARLESPEENPEDRTDFRHADLKTYVRSERPRLAAAGLTILRAYFAAGLPEMKIPPWGSFEAWSRLIRHAVVWAGQPDPWQARETIRDADQSADLIRLIHRGIEEADKENRGLTCAEMVRISNSATSEYGTEDPTLRMAVEELCEGKKVDARRIGYGLRKFKGRVCAGKRLRSRDSHGNVKRWFVESVKNPLPPDGGDGGDGGDEKHQSVNEVLNLAESF